MSHDIAVENIRFVALCLAIFTGLLMVSNFRYYSFKDVDLRGRVSFIWAILIMLVFAFMFTNPPLVLFTLFSVYAVSGLVLTLGRRHRIRTERRN